LDLSKIGSIKVLEKAGAILDVLREQERVTPAELMIRLAESRTTIVRICETMVKLSLLEREPTQRVSYRLGLGMLELGTLTAERLSLRRVASPVLEELAYVTGDSANLVVARGDTTVCLIRVEGHYPVVAKALREGGRLPFDRGGASQALLAYSDQDLRERVLRQLPAPRRRHLRAKVQEIRTLGYALSRAEFLPETAALGAAVFDAAGNAVAGISVSGILSRMADERIPELSAALLAAAERISRALGSTIYPRTEPGGPVTEQDSPARDR